jgi:hypothetical protein
MKALGKKYKIGEHLRQPQVLVQQRLIFLVWQREYNLLIPI